MSAPLNWNGTVYTFSNAKRKNERVDLADLMRQLGALGIDGLLLEGGSALAFSALEAGVVHRVQAYIAPKNHRRCRRKKSGRRSGI